MATYTMTYTVCDGCRRSNLHDDIDFLYQETVRKYGQDVTVDICEDCAENDMYYCRLCRRVHSDDNPCERQLEEIKAVQ